MGAVTGRAQQVLITTRQIELNDLYVGVQDTGAGLSLETLPRFFATPQNPTAWEWD